ncbi:hypothetical protein KC330_g8602 [Hortaea werneckii]|nr:hypothetical protein KC330_g8602 [Hortaea werneckii]
MNPSKSNSESPSRSPGNKPELTKERLGENDVFYNEDIYEPTTSGDIFAQMPLHIKYVRESLLNFRNSLPKFNEQYHELLRQDYRDLGGRMEDTERRMTRNWSLSPSDKTSEQSAWWKPTSDYPLRHQDPTNDQLQKDFYESQETAKKCKKRHSKLEPDWTPWLNSNIFKEYEETAFESFTGPQSSLGVPARHEIEIFEKWCIARDFRWNENLSGNTSPTHRESTGPKPDMTYAFPVFESLCDGFSQHECGASFSLTTLHQLRKDPSIQLVSTPTTGLSRAIQTSEGLIRKAPYGLSDSDLMCFPWAVVEVKHARVDQSKISNCYLQAANSSAVALRMLGELFKKATGSVPEDMPPIIAFTCIGPAVQVWLTYRAGPNRENGDKMVRNFDVLSMFEANSRQKIHMQCIYATHLELLWGVHSCRLVIKHMHVWASRILKPRIWICLSSLVSRKSLANGAATGLQRDSRYDEQVQSGLQSADEPSPSSKTPSKESRVKLPARSRRVSKGLGTASPSSSSSKKSAPQTSNVPKTGGAEEAGITPPESPKRPETPECRPTDASTFKSPYISGSTFAGTSAEHKPDLFGGSTSAQGKPGLFGTFHKAQKYGHSQTFRAGSIGKKKKNVSDSELEDLVSSFGTFGLHPENRDTPNKNTRARSSHTTDHEGVQQASDAQTKRYHVYRTGQPREIFVEEELDVDDGEWMPQHHTSCSCSSEGISDLSGDGSDEDSENGFDCGSEDQDAVCSELNSKSGFGSDVDIDPGSWDKPDVNHPKASHDANSTRLGSHPSSGDDDGDSKDALDGDGHFDRPANSDHFTYHHFGDKQEDEATRLSLGGWGPMSFQEFGKAEIPFVPLFGIRLLREHDDRTTLQRMCTLLLEAMKAQQCVEAMLCAGFDEHEQAWATLQSVALWQVNDDAKYSRKLPSMSWEEGACLD